MNLLKTSRTHKSFVIVLVSTSPASIRNHQAREDDFTSGPPVHSSTGLRGNAEKNAMQNQSTSLEAGKLFPPPI